MKACYRRGLSKHTYLVCPVITYTICKNGSQLNTKSLGVWISQPPELWAVSFYCL